MRTLKIWNGRGHGKFDNGHIYVAAYTQKQAAELIAEACNSPWITTHEIRTYYSKGCWGNSMDGIEPTEPCVYAENSQDAYKGKPKRII